MDYQRDDVDKKCGLLIWYLKVGERDIKYLNKLKVQRKVVTTNFPRSL